jgi:GxxExxY protein
VKKLDNSFNLIVEEFLHQGITSKIISCFYKVYNTLGYGFLEKVYENALMHKLIKSGLYVEKQKPINVWYDEQLVGEYFADLMVNNQIIIELKAAESLIEEHELQLINYLKATEIEVGLLLNFGKKPEIRRKIFSNKNKKIERR